MDQIGILGTGLYLPETKRLNDWWETSIADQWLRDKNRVHNSIRIDPEQMSRLPIEVRLVMEAVDELRDDPFEGSKLRYVMGEAQQTSDMEIEAGRQALDNAGLSPEDIGFLISHSTLPDFLADQQSCVVHKGLGLPESCYVQDVGGMCNAFLGQLFLAEALIRNGASPYGLLTQSSGMSRLLKRDHPMSPLFGDGATAVVVGKVPEGRGLLAMANYADGGLGTYLATGVPGKPWYEDGRISTYFYDATKGPSIVFSGVAQCKRLIEEALKKATLQKSDIQFFAGHQGVKWFRRVTQEMGGISHAQTRDTFADYASLVGGNIPLCLHLAQQQDLLRRDDLVAMYSPGTGVVASAAIMKWN